MAKSLDGWIHSFTVTDTCAHKKGFTIYKITSIVFPACIPEALTCLTIWKRFNDVKKLHKDIERRHKELHLRGTVPALLKDALYFKRFERAVIEDRKAFILKLLDFCAQHPALYKSHGFLQFFEKTHSPNLSPEHCIVKLKNNPLHGNSQTNSISSSSTPPSFIISGNNNNNNNNIVNNIRNIEKICKDISLNPEEYSLIDPNRDDDVDEAIESQKISMIVVQTNPINGINLDESGSSSSSSSSILTETNSSCGGDTFSNVSTINGGINDDACSTIRRTEYHKQFSNEIVTDQLIDDQPIDYIYEAALIFNSAVQYEIQLNYRQAFEHYKKGIDTLLMGVRNELEPNRKRIVKEKVKQYLNRAEDIYEQFILNDDELNKKSTIIVHHNNNNNNNNESASMDPCDNGGGKDSKNSVSNVDEDISTINLSNNDHELNSIKSFERPINQLAKFKVLTIIDNVMQVQDITNKKIYIMKAIQKSAITSTNSSQMFILPQNIPFMVSLLTFYQSETTIYLLLQQANGGKLWDYINAYQPKIVNNNTIDKTISLNSLFTEPIMERINKNTETKSIRNTECKHKQFNISELLSIHSMDYDTNRKIILNNDRQHQDIIPSHSQLSQDMDVIDLVNCSQKLLQSVTNTLEQIKDINDDDIEIDENLMINMNTDDNSYELAEEVLNTNLVVLNDLCDESIDDDREHVNDHNDNDTNESKQSRSYIENHSTVNEISIIKNSNLNQCQLLPKEIIKRWASELIMAIIKLHEKEIICFDLHPNNLLLGSNGELLLTYFYRRITNNNNCTATMSAVVVGGNSSGGGGAVSKSIQQQTNSNLNELNDRSELLNSDALKQLYVAPERPLTKISDWWSIGVLLFELMTGHTFLSCHPGGVSTYYEVQYPQIIPDISDDCKELLNGLLDINPNKRLTGYHVQNHQYFESINWVKLTNTGNTGITTITDENIIQC